MNRSIRRALGVVSGAVVVSALAGTPAAAAPSPAPVQDFLAQQLSLLAGATPTTVMVHGTDIAAARAAVDATGMRTITEFEKISVVVASGTTDQIEATRTRPGVTYLEGNTPIEFYDETSNEATRGAEAAGSFTGADGAALDGSGVSVAVIDSASTRRTPPSGTRTGRAPWSRTSRASASSNPTPLPTASSPCRASSTPTPSPAAGTART